MDRAGLLAKIAAANGRVALRLGESCAQYRAAGAAAPITAASLVGTLEVFLAPSQRLQERPEWIAEFDYSATAAGDYLVTSAGVTYFIGCQVAFAPIVCIQTNATVSLLRPVAVAGDESSDYSGVGVIASTTELAGWPASIVAMGRAKPGLVPNDEGLSGWSVLLPPLPVVPMVADLITDDAARSFVVISAERTSLGWELHTRQVSS